MNLVVAAHLIGIVLWVGGLLVLTRLLAFHCDLPAGEARDALAGFETNTYRFVAALGAGITFIAGIFMLFVKGDGVSHYVSPAGVWGATFHLKLTAVFVLLAMDHVVMRKMKKLQREGEGSRSTFVKLHGVIAVLFILIIVAVKTNILG
jgi:uncharacterized membrane protein